MMRFVRTLVSFVLLGFAATLVGCDGQQAAGPALAPDTKKQLAEDMKRQAQERKEEMRRGRGR